MSWVFRDVYEFRRETLIIDGYKVVGGDAEAGEWCSTRKALRPRKQGIRGGILGRQRGHAIWHSVLPD